MALDGSNPTFLDGYGGFNIADMPFFSISRILFLDNFNGILAVANLRGGRWISIIFQKSLIFKVFVVIFGLNSWRGGAVNCGSASLP